MVRRVQGAGSLAIWQHRQAAVGYFDGVIGLVMCGVFELPLHLACWSCVLSLLAALPVVSIWGPGWACLLHWSMEYWAVARGVFELSLHWWSHVLASLLHCLTWRLVVGWGSLCNQPADLPWCVCLLHCWCVGESCVLAADAAVSRTVLALGCAWFAGFSFGLCPSVLGVLLPRHWPTHLTSWPLYICSCFRCVPKHAIWWAVIPYHPCLLDFARFPTLCCLLASLVRTS